MYSVYSILDFAQISVSIDLGGMNKGLSILNVSTNLQLAAKGAIIVMAIALDNFLYRWSES
jgi:ribose/xylose/arabinose/galactoside ABC-type transport system permease subunit